MPKDAKKNVDRYKVGGGHLNEFEFRQNQGQVKEAARLAKGDGWNNSAKGAGAEKLAKPAKSASAKQSASTRKGAGTRKSAGGKLSVAGKKSAKKSVKARKGATAKKLAAQKAARK